MKVVISVIGACPAPCAGNALAHDRPLLRLFQNHAVLQRDRPVKIRGRSSQAPGEATRVRYAWAGTPIVNLYNRDGFPASPFALPIK